MNDSAIKVEHLSKRYRIGLREEKSDSLVKSLSKLAVTPIRNFRRLRKLSKFSEGAGSNDVIWALKDVSFEVKRGEVIGVIGNNGAGKTTLLKILSRITDPTEGGATINGRVGSLLEVGTGFHPELTGRDNTYLNGTILGMTRKEVSNRFDEIVEFSGIEQFIDTPVKRYSNGMKVRLAFAIAANLEPEILMIDEVLAVGDVGFQRKCLGKMGSVASSGRTVLLVSHNMGAITSICPRSIWLQGGQIHSIGPSSEVVASYLLSEGGNDAEWTNSAFPDAASQTEIKSARILSQDNRPTAVHAFDESFQIEIGYEIINPIRGQAIACQLTDLQGNNLIISYDTDTTVWNGQYRERGNYTSTCKVPGGLLRPGRYLLSVSARSPKISRSSGKITEHINVLAFEISEQGFPFSGSVRGIFTPLLEWQVTPEGHGRSGRAAAMNT